MRKALSATYDTAMLNITEAFAKYCAAKEDGKLVTVLLGIYDEMTEYVLRSRSVDSNVDLLLNLQKLRNNEEGRDLFSKFIRSYFEYLRATNRGIQEVVDHLLEVSTKLSDQSKTWLIGYLCAMRPVQLSLTTSGITTGKDCMTKTIFHPMMAHSANEYTPNSLSYSVYSSLCAVMEEDAFNNVFEYLWSIAKLNVAYTYDSISEHKTQLATYELLGTVLIAFFKLIVNNRDHFVNGNGNRYAIKPEFAECYWDVINILYLTLYDIRENTTRSINVKKRQLADVENRTDLEESQIDEARQVLIKFIQDSKEGLVRLEDIFANIDVDEIEKFMFEENNMRYITDASIVHRIRVALMSFKPAPNSESAARICRFVSCMLERSYPPYLKSELIRYVMAFGLSGDYVTTGNTDTDGRDNKHMYVLSNYLLTDARKLENIRLIHSMDVLQHFSRHLYRSTSGASYERCSKIIRLYLGYLPEAIEVYEKMCEAFSECPEETKPHIISDMTTVIGYSVDLADMLSLVGNEALSYIDSLVGLAKTIIDTKEELSDIDDAEVEIFGEFRRKTLGRFKSLFETLFDVLEEKTIFFREYDDIDVDDSGKHGDDEDSEDSEDSSNSADSKFTRQISSTWRTVYSMYYPRSDASFCESVFRLVYHRATVDTCRELFGIELDNGSNLIISETSELPDYMIDSITYDTIISPIIIPTRSDEQAESTGVLVDQKTMHKLLLDNKNPYTNEPLSHDQIINLNSVQSNIELLDLVIDTLRTM